MAEAPSGTTSMRSRAMNGRTDGSMNWPWVPAAGKRLPSNSSRVALTPTPRRLTPEPRVALAAPFWAEVETADGPRPITCGTLRSRSDAVVAPLLTIWSRLSETGVEPTAATPRMRVPVTTTSVTVSAEAGVWAWAAEAAAPMAIAKARVDTQTWRDGTRVLFMAPSLAVRTAGSPSIRLGSSRSKPVR